MPEFELGDDGEFTEAVDSRYGVYSIHPRRNYLPLLFVLSSVFACTLIFAALYWSGSF